MLTSELKGNRTLATVLFTDCVGFSARMSVNEEHTLDLIRRDLKLMKNICDTFEGRVLKSTGDGLLMCFSSAVKAVECAIAIQHAIAEAVRTLPPSDALMHRIGIHLADMYITATDVMGNGVNIAARLQTEADPGGICISQTVYDVAKQGLQLEIEYLGPRELKNIREVVPAYRVLLDTERDSSDPYAETARYLEQSGNVSRIRKLIYYVCKNHWENDDAKLATLNLKGIIHEFLGLASNYNQLKSLLHTAVGTLSKQSEYTLVANEILRGVAKFYAPDRSLHFWQGQLLPEVPDSSIAAMELPDVDPATYHLVAQKVDQHPDGLRLKKLLYYICRRHWDSDPARLGTVPTRQLLEEVSRVAVDLPQLKIIVDKFVQTLNKRTEYALVAIALVGLLGELFGESSAEVSTGSPISPGSELARPSPLGESTASSVALDPKHYPQVYAAIATRLDHDPNGPRFKKLLFYLCKGQWLKDATQLGTTNTRALLEELVTLVPSPERLQQQLQTVVKNLSKQAEYGAIAQVLLQMLRPLYRVAVLTNPPPPAPAPSVPIAATANQSSVPLMSSASADPSPGLPSTQAAPPPRSTFNLFDVRLGILKYTNPLKAKILAFSALYSDFSFNEQDWFNLKMYELDGLLRGLLATCQNYTDLEHLLYSTARRLTQPDELVQTADTVTKYLRTFYIHGNPSILTHFSTTDETKISLDDFEAATQGIANLNEDEQTRGLAPFPPFGETNASSLRSGPHTHQISTVEQDPTGK
ncbi:MAG: adenylate/guanylate cyclase domain-containing protein [Leptolyngbyaceae cyanobacterium bins.349]|nr:adenylate/guanylate cyclase domain-containing protein [Leptolyngbyaceae cyanobacterium bins.349]